MPRPPFPPAIEARLTDDPIRARSDLPQGWVDLVLGLDTAIAGYDPNYVLVQVKEKFGGLRYYIEHKHNDMCGAATRGVPCLKPSVVPSHSRTRPVRDAALPESYARQAGTGRSATSIMRRPPLDHFSSR